MQVADYLKSLDGETWVIMEHTGRYYELVARFLHDAGLYVSAVNPKLIKDYGNNPLRKVKTDKADARKIAKYGLDSWMELRQYVSMDMSSLKYPKGERVWAGYYNSHRALPLDPKGFADREMYADSLLLVDRLHIARGLICDADEVSILIPYSNHEDSTSFLKILFDAVIYDVKYTSSGQTPSWGVYYHYVTMREVHHSSNNSCDIEFTANNCNTMRAKNNFFSIVRLLSK